MFFLVVPLCLLIGCVLALAYVYLVFPMAMVMVAKCAAPIERGALGDRELPSVTLIIPAYNEESVIGQKLRNALALDYPEERLEIIVGCDGGSDQTAAIAESLANSRIRILDFSERRGKAAVINDVVEQANGEVLLLCDANVMFAADSLRLLVQVLAADNVGAVSGDVRLDSARSSFGAGESAYYRLERAVHRGESAIASVMGVDGGMYVLRKELFRSIPNDTILDDFTISMGVIRAGHRILYFEEAIATENATEAAKIEYERRVRLSAGAAQALLRGNFPPLSQTLDLWLFISHKLLRWLSPFLILIALAAAVALTFQQGPYWVTMLGRTVVIAFAGLLLVAAVGGISTRLRKKPLIGIPFYFVMSQVAIARGMLKGVRGQLDPRWERTLRSTNEN
ncbi:MAG: glycosyltransferase family 2 protein [Rubripirellula sp.]|nr:glycosyltransferase family 2 protein [Rubripirellula sp.]